jgi:hypothetical protein
MNGDYSSGPVSAATMAGIRILLVAIGSFAVGRGWVDAEHIEGIITGIITIGVAGYGIWKTLSRQKQIKVAENTLGPVSPKGLGQ